MSRVLCDDCGQPFKEEETVYQIRAGWVNEHGCFEPDEDVGLFHGNCWLEKQTIIRKLGEKGVSEQLSIDLLGAA